MPWVRKGLKKQDNEFRGKPGEKTAPKRVTIPQQVSILVQNQPLAFLDLLITDSGKLCKPDCFSDYLAYFQCSPDPPSGDISAGVGRDSFEVAYFTIFHSFPPA